MPQVFTIAKDITGDDYIALINAAAKRFSSFSLVWQDRLTFNESALSIRRDLRRYRIAGHRTNRWPGTEVFEAKADVMTCRFEAKAKAVLLRPRSLFGWRAPHYPEDLAFYDAKGRCTFASVSHEGDAWILDLQFGRSMAERLHLAEEDMRDDDYRMFGRIA